MRSIVLFFLLSGMLTACGGRESKPNSNQENGEPQKLQIITTIKPLQAIVTAISGEYVDSYQLIPDYASPHNYSFKPSDIRKVNRANVIFRIDEDMELMLNPVFKNLAKNTELVSLAELKGINLLATSGKSNNDHGHNVENGNINFHIWTSPKNTLVMAISIAQTLTRLDLKNTNYYKDNLAAFIQKVEKESAKISTTLANKQNKAYIVFHDSWRYFTTEFHLQEPIVVNLHESLSLGAKTLSEIRTKILAKNIGCIFYDSSLAPAQIKLLSEKQKLKTNEIDVLARKLEINQDTYINWLIEMGTQVNTCLEG